MYGFTKINLATSRKCWEGLLANSIQTDTNLVVGLLNVVSLIEKVISLVFGIIHFISNSIIQVVISTIYNLGFQLGSNLIEEKIYIDKEIVIVLI